MRRLSEAMRLHAQFAALQAGPLLKRGPARSDQRWVADLCARRDSRGRAVQLLDREAGSRLVARHELGAFLLRDDIVDAVERAAAALIHHIEQPERPRAAIAQHQLRD